MGMWAFVIIVVGLLLYFIGNRSDDAPQPDVEFQSEDHLQPQPPLVVLRTYISSVQADYAVSLLHSSDVPAMLFDQNLTRIHPFAAAATGGIRLMVQQQDLPRATEVLDEYGDYYPTHLDEDDGTDTESA